MYPMEVNAARGNERMCGGETADEGWWRKVNDSGPTGEIKRATKRRKSIFNFVGKRPDQQRRTSRCDLFVCFIPNLTENSFAVCFLIF